MKDFHATAVRKMWDTHFHNNRKNFNDSVFNSHLHQTGHSATTARESCVVTEKSEALKTYLSELSKLQDSSEDFAVQSSTTTNSCKKEQKAVSTPNSTVTSKSSSAVTTQRSSKVTPQQSSTVTPMESNEIVKVE